MTKTKNLKNGLKKTMKQWPKLQVSAFRSSDKQERTLQSGQLLISPPSDGRGLTRPPRLSPPQADDGGREGRVITPTRPPPSEAVLQC